VRHPAPAAVAVAICVFIAAGYARFRATAHPRPRWIRQVRGVLLLALRRTVHLQTFYSTEDVTTAESDSYIASLLTYSDARLFSLWSLADRSRWNDAVGLVGAVFVLPPVLRRGQHCVGHNYSRCGR
jgi:hypothetical protein